MKTTVGEQVRVDAPGPLVSVVVPVYRVEPYLRRCLDSILAQTHTDLEVVVVDDGSPDGCPAIVDEYAARDPRVVALHQRNQGLGPARNAGLALARGDYVAFVDSDDHVHPRYVATLLDRCLATGADVAACGFVFDLRSGRRLPVPLLTLRSCLTGDQASRKALDMFALPNFAWNKLYRRELLVDHGLAFPAVYYEDTAAMPALLHRARRVAIARRSLYHYCLRDSSITGAFTGRNIGDFVQVARMVRGDVEGWAEGRRWDRAFRRFLSHAWFYLGVSIARHPRLSYDERLATLQRTHEALAALRPTPVRLTHLTVSDVAVGACGLLRATGRLSRRVREPGARPTLRTWGP